MKRWKISPILFGEYKAHMANISNSLSASSLGVIYNMFKDMARNIEIGEGEKYLFCDLEEYEKEQLQDIGFQLNETVSAKIIKM